MYKCVLNAFKPAVKANSKLDYLIVSVVYAIQPKLQTCRFSQAIRCKIKQNFPALGNSAIKSSDWPISTLARSVIGQLWLPWFSITIPFLFASLNSCDVIADGEDLNTERSYITRLRCSACQSQTQRTPMLPSDWLVHSSLILASCHRILFFCRVSAVEK